MISPAGLVLVVLGILPTFAFPAPAGYPDLGTRATALPSMDPFYDAPENLSAYAPGAIIRSRHPPAPLSFYTFKTNLESAWQLLYRTTGAGGEPLATVTTVLIPYNADFGKLLSYQVEIDAPYEACFPSITLQQPNAHLDTISAQYGELWFISALERGWVVAVPDHEGPNGAFVSGLVGGHSTLDGLRAVLRSNSVTGVSPHAKMAIWGYSGGALATEFALELHQEYAPELEITAAAVGGVPANIKNAFGKINKSIGAGLATGGILGLTKAYPTMKTLVDKKVFKENSSRLYEAQEQCLIPTIVQFAFQDIFSYFQDGSDFLNEPVIRDVLEENAMGHRNTSKVPTYMYHGINDELLPFEDAQRLYDKYCSSGANIHFTKESFGEHIIVALTGAAGALKYLVDHMEGRPAQSGCSSITVVSSSLAPENLPYLGEIVFNDVQAILGKPVGPVAWLANGR